MYFLPSSIIFEKNPFTLNSIVGQVPANFNIISSGSNFSPSVNCWTLSGASVSTPSFPGPDGSTTAQHLTEDNTNSVHQDFANNSNANGWVLTGNGTITTIPTMRFAVIAKAAERTRMVLSLSSFNQGATTTGASMGFDLAGGNTNYSSSHDADWAITAASITPITKGYQLCIFDVTCNNAAPISLFAKINLDNGSGTAANSVSYAGDGSSGIILWFASLLPLQAWSLTQRTFFDDFTSATTIDYNDTQLPGFNWYLHTARDNYPDPAVLHGTPSCPPGDVLLANSIVTLVKDVTGFGQTIMGTCETLGNPAGSTGVSFTLPFLVEGLMAWDKTFADNTVYTGPSNAFWTTSEQILQGVTRHGAESDFMEGAQTAGPTVWLTNIHDYTVVPPFVTNFTQDPPGGNQPSTITDFHRIASMHFPANENNNNIGSRWSFFDGIYTISQISWTTTGFLDVFNEHNFAINIAGGTRTAIIGGAVSNWSLYIDWIRVFQNPNAPPTLSLAAGTVTGNTTATLSVNTTQTAGTLYWVVTTSSTPPTSAQIVAGQDNSSSPAAASGSQSVSAIGPQTASATGLTGGTAYSVWFVQKITGGVSNIPNGSVFTTTGSSYTGPGDIVSGAVGWWGLRAYNMAARGTKAIRLRANDGTQSDFNSLAGSGALDTSSITTFQTAHGAPLTVAKIYDQTGNGNDLVQATTANQPTFSVNGGPGGKPVIGLTATLNVVSPNITQARPLTISWVMERTGNFSSTAGIGDGTGIPRTGFISANTVFLFNGLITATAADSAYHAVQAIFQSSGNSNLNVDGTDNLSAAAGAGFLGDSFQLNVDAALIGNFLETGLWPSDISANAAAMSTNQHTFWGF